MKLSFVIGNGHSRSVFDVTKLNDHGVTYGCNLLIEDMQLHNTVVCDRTLLVNLISQGYDKLTNLWTRPRWRKMLGNGDFMDLPIPVSDPKTRYDEEIHWGSGTHAVHLAATQGSDVIVMIGFDIWPRDDGMNNIYSSRQDFYDDKKVVDPEHWIYQISVCLDKFPSTDFVQIQPSSWKDPNDWVQRENYTRDDYAGLNAMLRNM